MAKVKYTLLIPFNYNDGSKIPEAELHAVYQKLYDMADGYTLAGTVTGAFRMKDGSKQVDHSNEIRVAIEENLEPELKQLVAEACHRLQQEALYLERSEATITLVPPMPFGEKK